MSKEKKAEMAASIDCDVDLEKVEGMEGEEAGDGEENAAEANVTIPEQLNLDSLGDEEAEEDAMTVATSALDTASVAASAVPTSYYSKRTDEIGAQLAQERQRRLRLENQMAALKQQLNIAAQASKIKQEAMGADGADNIENKMRLIEQRNLLLTGENYTTHPQFENL